jgi:hypothetical protein
MDERPYPEGIDGSWLASDRDGHLGVFVIAGCGPIPAQTLNPAYPLDEIEEDILKLPKASDVDFPGQAAEVDRFVDLAERGFFVYDWSDVHRVIQAYINAYELVARPYRPLTLDQLPDDLADAARSVRFTRLSFANAWRVDVRAHMICREVPS